MAGKFFWDEEAGSLRPDIVNVITRIQTSVGFDDEHK